MTADHGAEFEVRYVQAKESWHVSRGNYTEAWTDTQQAAVDIAKGAAQEVLGSVIWYDRDGAVAGEVDYRPFHWRVEST